MRIFISVLYLSVGLLQTLCSIPSVASSTFTRGQKYDTSSSIAREEVEKEFLQWVQRVGAKQRRANSSDWIYAGRKDVVSSVITVDKNGNGSFLTVGAALNSLPSHNMQRVIIKIGPGTYQEKIKLSKNMSFITFQGAGMGLTKITWNDTANNTGTTFLSATVSVMAPYFIARDICFENSAPAPQPGQVGQQAVAFQISGDKSAFYNCAFYGAQDTLYDHMGRHYFKNCYIVGSIDFIFGDGLSLYENCQLHTLQTPAGSLTAQKRKTPIDDSGFSFKNCSVTGSGNVFLGRAWGNYSRVVFIYTYMDNVITPAGWYNWGVPDREKTAFYGEYQCYGPGAELLGRVGWAHELTLEQATPFMSLSFIDGESWVTL